MDILGRIPDEGEQPQVEYENLVMKVLEMSERRILKIRITVRPPEENPEDEADEKTSENSREEKSKTDSPEKGYEDIEKKKMDLMNEKNKK